MGLRTLPGGNSDTGWINLPLNAGWGVSVQPRYRKVSGIVYMEGLVLNTTGVGNSTVVGTLPVGFRPSALQMCSSYAIAQVAASGDVSPFGPVAAADALALYVSFPAA